MFDTQSIIEFPKFRSAKGIIELSVRWPTDEEWTQHFKETKQYLQTLGRGRNETIRETAEADRRLVEKIKLNGAPTLTLGESVKVVAAIGLCDVMACELGADEAQVRLQTMSGDVDHFLKIPSLDDVQELKKTEHLIQLQFGRFEMKNSIQAAVALWDRCMTRVEGYVKDVPNIHKDVAIRAVILQINQEVQPRHDESDF
jgi:hypothetical protein